jgi:WD40 repeat protein
VQADAAKGDSKGQTAKKGAPKDTPLPLDSDNPHAKTEFPIMELERFKLHKTVKAHTATVSGCPPQQPPPWAVQSSLTMRSRRLALHPTRPAVATTSDDGTWKLWTMASGELVMTGAGHRDWVGSCDFHPSYADAPPPAPQHGR